MSSTSKGLPGFLRRSLRVEYDEDDDEEDQVQIISSGSATNARALNNSEARGSDEPSILPSHPVAVEKVPTPFSSTNMTAEKPERVLGKQQSVPVTIGQSAEDVGLGINSSKMNESWHERKSDEALSMRKKEKAKTYQEQQFEKTIGANIIAMTELKRLAWNGIPPPIRSQAWKILLGYLPTNASRRVHTLQRKRAEYRDAIAQHYDIDDNSRTHQEQEVLRQVLVDVPRTAPQVPLFRDERIRRMLSRLLYIWAMRHPASSYVQGLNDLVTPLIVTFLSEGRFTIEDVLEGTIMDKISVESLDEVEADSYWCLTNILAGIQDHYTADQPGVQRMVLRLQELVNRIDANLCHHMRDVGVEFMQFAFKWMNCLLLREFSLRCVIRLWDTYLSEQDGFEDFHVYVCAAFLCQFSTQLQSMSFDDLFTFMQSMPTDDWGDTEIEMLLSQAYVLSTLFGGSDAHLSSSHGAGM